MGELSLWLRSKKVSLIVTSLLLFFYRHGIQTPVNQAMVFFVKALEAKFLGEKQNWEVFM